MPQLNKHWKLTGAIAASTQQLRYWQRLNTMVRGLLLALPKLDLFSYLSEEDTMYCWVAILSVDVPSYCKCF